MNALCLPCIEATSTWTSMTLPLAYKCIFALAKSSNNGCTSSMRTMQAAFSQPRKPRVPLGRAACITSVALHASAMACLFHFRGIPPTSFHHHSAQLLAVARAGRGQGSRRVRAGRTVRHGEVLNSSRRLIKNF